MVSLKTSSPVPANNWIKPQIVKLGRISDVAGNNTVNANGVGNNLKS